jgi:transposase-like protein
MRQTRRGESQAAVAAMTDARAIEGGAVGSGGERSEPEDPTGGARRGRPGRRGVHERTDAVLALMAGKASVDQLARRFGVHATTIEKWREIALEGVSTALRQGAGKSAEVLALEKRLKQLERAFTDVAIKKELLERFLAERPIRPTR